MTPSGTSGAPMLPPPSPDEWRRLEPLIDAVLDAPVECRAELLAEASGGDAARLAELERLVAECERAYPLLEQPVADRFAAIFGDDAPRIPELLADRYRILREVGRGGMAIVYLARDVKHGRDVAVKVVRPELAAALGRSRFLREIEIAARLRHPHIVPLYDSGEVPATSANSNGNEPGSSLLYYVMPYEPGHSLRERLTQRGPLPIADVVLIVHDVCEALSHAHQHGIVHRDIKPENVLLSGRHALITDFGVARAVSEATVEASGAVAGVAFGTPTYMAPEQAASDPDVDHRADIYALGVLAYELLAGRPPFEKIERARRSHHAPDVLTPLFTYRSDVPDALAALIMKCLAPLPADRWQRADHLLAQLAAVRDPAGGSGATGGSRRAASWAAMFLGAALGLTLLVALAITLTRSRDERAPLALGRARRLTSDAGLEVQPSMSPDGRRVAYATGHSLQMRIAVRDVAGGKAMFLTTDSTVNQWLPRWSPDGARILF
ncbi:MAG: serine/threonine-protein kinase, partial [Gemmatimonadaceae bacterium]|nr:serine/threonine-protein kinase [Gemmatimonadaceae bacterium]